ncbi:hypothetical protein FA13DRAFT_1126198 [Coprinellus micaceus]|uniref:Uncharacterized protein n=1 Tax=Coprinellus micaceus TaxID=71717 RepID=A0A4Y7SVW5_COPMI|nr:hypothetical protein FA13DRAFT_1126198 [Coprinellus micaceus]
MVAFVNCTSDIAYFARVLGWLEDGDIFGRPTPSRAYSVLEWRLSNPGDFRGYGTLLRTLIVAISLYVYATLFMLHLPSYFRNRASPFLQSSPSKKEDLAVLWATVFCPLLDKWRAVVVLSSLTASAILGMIQASPNLKNDAYGLPLVYFTLVTGMISVLLSSLVLFHVSGREHNDTFMQALRMEMKTCSAFSLWNIWIMVALPSIW